MSATATLPAPATTATPTPMRSAALDRLRGVAVALMVLDHLLMVFGPESVAGPVRNTVTRLAMPLFAVLAGHLARRVSWRLGWVFLLGLILSAVVPAFGAPSILTQLAWYCALLVVCRWLCAKVGIGPAFVAAGMVFMSFLAFANGYAQDVPGGYPDEAVMGLVGLGALLSRGQLTRQGELLPRFLGLPGRYPLTVYVGHIAVIVAVARVA